MTLAASALQNISLLLFSKHDCLKMDQHGMDLVTTFFGPFWGVAAAAFWKGHFGTAKISWVTLRLVKYSKKVIWPEWIESNARLGGGNSNIFYFHPENWGRFPI